VSTATSDAAFGRVLVDGQLVARDDARVSVFDVGFQRGYGCFEALRSYGGKPFRAAAHYGRLAVSAEKLAIDLAAAETISGWIHDRAARGGDCMVRVFVTGGLEPGKPGVGSTVVVFAEPLPKSTGPMRVLPLDAPWHPDGHPSELTGVKTMSYGPNLAASIAARRAGYDDALLIGRSGYVLEGPTYAVGWFVEGVIETPSLTLGILASITRQAVLEIAEVLGVSVQEGDFSLDRLLDADEVFAMSTGKEIQPIAVAGDRALGAGVATSQLQSAFRALVAAELGIV
jgi:branched-subunit amino acid aminotransferase/4-amino-4-deoxychorismate lyase